MTELIGHEDVWLQWREAMASPRMHHGWILAGPEGLGKASFARQAARELLREADAPSPAAEHHPDILVVDPLPASDDDEKKRDEGKPFALKRNISIDQIRKTLRRLETRPTLGSRRTVIIDCADDLERPGANALLKALEEPPQGTFFLLISHKPGRLLPTIRSRCRVLRFAPLNDSQLQGILRQSSLVTDSEQDLAAIAAAKGSAGAALRFREFSLGATYRLMQQILSDGDDSLTLRAALAQAIGSKPDRKRMSATLELAQVVLAKALEQSERAKQARIINAHGLVMQLSQQVPTYNFDPGLLSVEIGTLLANAALSHEAALA